MEQTIEKQNKTSCSAGHIIFWITSVVGVGLDLWSKAAVFDWLSRVPHRAYMVVEGFFYLVIAENPGAAFGIASGKQYFLIGVSIVALLVILGIYIFGKSLTKIMYFALGLFTAGIAGNLYDRIFNDGKVRDFIDIVYWPSKHWPTFNIADTMLCVGVGVILISGIFSGKPDQKLSQPQKSGS